MEAFWTIVWIMILIIPAIWLASIIWSVVMYLIALIIGLVVTFLQWVFGKR